MNKNEIFRKIKNALNDKEQLVLASMLDGDSVVESAKNCGISVQFAQSYRKTIYETVGEFVDFGNDKKQKQKILIDFMFGYELATSDEKKEPEEAAPAEDEKAAEKTLQEIKKYICLILGISEELNYKELIDILHDWKRSDEQFTDLVNENNQLKKEKSEFQEENEELKTTNDELMNKNDELRNESNRLFDELERLKESFNKMKDNVLSNKSNFFVFNPYRDKPNKVYKSYDAAFKDASDVAMKSQNAVFVLRIDTLVVPHCEIEAVDVTGSGIPEKYLQEEIPF